MAKEKVAYKKPKTHIHVFDIVNYIVFVMYNSWVYHVPDVMSTYVY